MDPELDQGIRYELAALEARPVVLRRICVAYPVARIVTLGQGLALVPLTRGLAAALAAGAGRLPPETGFHRLSPGLYALLTSVSNVGAVGYLEADYIGRDGWQTAAVWEGGEQLYGPEILHRSEPFPATGGGPFGAALRALGATAVGRDDEFVALGLGRRRRAEDWA